MKYAYCQGKSGAWIEPYNCDNWFCEPELGGLLDTWQLEQDIVYSVDVGVIHHKDLV